jgi:ferredoxin-type protein NapH
MPPLLDRARRPAALWVLVALLLFAAAAFAGDMDVVRAQTTYGNFDVPSDRSGVQSLAPGVPDLAREKVYRFGPDVPVHGATIRALLIVFAVFLVLRLVGGTDARFHIRRGWTQWSAFVLARAGVLRAADAVPVARCTLGTFPFLNCQFCEMASGACPVGVAQGAIQGGRAPTLAAGTLVGVGALSGRWICGWLCPFGMLLDCCEKANPRRAPDAPRWLRSGKYVVLGLLLLSSGVLGALGVTAIYGFCATLCPAGLLFGLVPYYGTTAWAPFRGVLAAFDPTRGDHLLVAGHLLLLVVFLFLALRVWARGFCSVACPLGAVLALFSRISLVRVVHHEERCDGCGACARVCPMGIDLGRGDALTVSDCIQCTRCIRVCPTGARTWSFADPAAIPFFRRARHVRSVPPAPRLPAPLPASPPPPVAPPPEGS